MKKDQEISDLSDDGIDDDLLTALQQCTRFVPPDDFLLGTVDRFQVAVRRNFGWAVAMGIAAALSVSTPLFWFTILHIKEVTKALAACVSACAVVVEFIVTLWSQLPEMGTGILLSLWVATFIVVAMLVKVFKITVSEQNAAG
ncbi:MAG: hypothetical protein JXX29_15850 [Deltaproteobacteria bacterium]|nr:hypothetical protein [Deltaproteobacteria bacterium]MBN2673155.1 hypothetical protein [Deltaproteobacteria bacterium]